MLETDRVNVSRLPQVSGVSRNFVKGRGSKNSAEDRAKEGSAQIANE
jgi:hypothetical protein